MYPEDTIRVVARIDTLRTIPSMTWVKRAQGRMRDLGLRQEDLKETLGVKTRGAVGHYFRGRRQLSAQQIAALAGKLGMSIDELFSDEYELKGEASFIVSRNDDMERYPALPAMRRVNVRGVVVVDAHGLIPQVAEDPEGNGYFHVETEDKDAYFLRIRGPGSTFIAKPGWYVLLAPNSEPLADEDVIAKLSDGRFLAGSYVRHEAGEFVIRRPDGALAVLAEADVEYVHPIHGTMSPRQLHR